MIKENTAVLDMLQWYSFDTNGHVFILWPVDRRSVGCRHGPMLRTGGSELPNMQRRHLAVEVPNYSVPFPITRTELVAHQKCSMLSH